VGSSSSSGAVLDDPQLAQVRAVLDSAQAIDQDESNTE
jgi:hypothetical protein